MNRRGMLALAWLGWATQAMASAPQELRAEWPQAASLVRQGEATMRFLGLAVYDIRLWVQQPVPTFEWDRMALALEIEYARPLSGQRIAERSLTEMRRSGPVAEGEAERWLAAMRGVFPDVEAGHRITGVQVPGSAARFYVNGRPVGEIRDGRFTRLFFGIWLAPWTSEPQLRRQLLGASP